MQDIYQYISKKVRTDLLYTKNQSFNRIQKVTCTVPYSRNDMVTLRQGKASEIAGQHRVTITTVYYICNFILSDKKEIFKKK